MSAKPESKTMLDRISSLPSNKEMIEQGQLPHGSLLHLETALTYARMAAKSGTTEQKDDFLKVVIEHLEEIKKKVEAVK